MLTARRPPARRLVIGLELIHNAQLPTRLKHTVGLGQSLLGAGHHRQNQMHDDDIEVLIGIEQLSGIHDVTSHISLITLGPGAGASDHTRCKVGQVYF